MTERLLLVGMMGAGKSTAGKLAAERLGWPFVDVDAEVESATGMSVAELFSRSGEAAFRAEESAALERALERSPAVVSVGGGAVQDERNRRRMRHGATVVWLRARPETLAERVGDGRTRPLLHGDDPVARLAELAAARAPLYAEVADVVVDVDELHADEVATRVAALAGSGPRTAP